MGPHLAARFDAVHSEYLQPKAGFGPRRYAWIPLSGLTVGVQSLVLGLGAYLVIKHGWRNHRELNPRLTCASLKRDGARLDRERGQLVAAKASTGGKSPKSSCRSFRLMTTREARWRRN